MLDGFRARKSDGEPGVKTVWIGLQRIMEFAAGVRFMRESGDAVSCVQWNEAYGHRTGTGGHEFSGEEKGLADADLLTLVFTGRDGGIRTHDPLHPIHTFCDFQMSTGVHGRLDIPL